MIIRYFQVQKEGDKETNERIWNENYDKIIFCPNDIVGSRKNYWMNYLLDLIREHPEKTYFALRYPSQKVLESPLLQRLKVGLGIEYNGMKHVWYPSEIWIYR